jgi:MFS transporter, CP family, cyanate transporter
MQPPRQTALLATTRMYCCSMPADHDVRTQRHRDKRQAVLLLVGLFTAALALRPQLVGVGPLLSTIQHDLRVSHSTAGLLSTLIIVCMGLFAPAAYLISGRVGSRLTIGAALALIAGAGVARAQVPAAAGVIALTLPIGIGVGIAGSLMPLAVSESWAGRPVLATGVYTTGISLGSAVSAALALPLSQLFGGWRGALTAMSVFTGVLTIVWLTLTRGYVSGRLATAARTPLPLRSRTAWGLVGTFALVSVLYYGLNAWLPASFTERGWSHASAGNLLTVLNGVTVPVSIGLAWRGDHFGSRRSWLISGTTIALVALLGVIGIPSLGWAWAAMLGASIGILFPSIMTMPLDVADRPSDVGAMAALMLGAGYTASALAPYILGMVRDRAGSFTLALWLIVADVIVLLVGSICQSHERLKARSVRPGVRH